MGIAFVQYKEFLALKGQVHSTGGCKQLMALRIQDHFVLFPHAFGLLTGLCLFPGLYCLSQGLDIKSTCSLWNKGGICLMAGCL